MYKQIKSHLSLRKKHFLGDYDLPVPRWNYAVRFHLFTTTYGIRFS